MLIVMAVLVGCVEERGVGGAFGYSQVSKQIRRK